MFDRNGEDSEFFCRGKKKKWIIEAKIPTKIQLHFLVLPFPLELRSSYPFCLHWMCYTVAGVILSDIYLRAGRRHLETYLTVCLGGNLPKLSVLFGNRWWWGICGGTFDRCNFITYSVNWLFLFSALVGDIILILGSEFWTKDALKQNWSCRRKLPCHFSALFFFWVSRIYLN